MTLIKWVNNKTVITIVHFRAKNLSKTTSESLDPYGLKKDVIEYDRLQKMLSEHEEEIQLNEKNNKLAREPLTDAIQLFDDQIKQLQVPGMAALTDRKKS